MASAAFRKSLKAIEELGACLVFPLDNRPEPRSLWQQLYPRSKMRWEWDSDGDNRVASLWQLREELSRSGEVVYTKWYKGRATFFSKPAFRDLLAFLGTTHASRPAPGPARRLLDELEDRSPLSTKELKKLAELRGRDLEKDYARAMKRLWEEGWIVAWGEVNEGAFPSLAQGATALLFESLWTDAKNISDTEAGARLLGLLGSENPFWKFAQSLRAR